MLDVLQRRGLSVSAVGIDGKGPILEGDPSLGRTVDVIPSYDGKHGAIVITFSLPYAISHHFPACSCHEQ